MEFLDEFILSKIFTYLDKDKITYVDLSTVSKIFNDATYIVSDIYGSFNDIDYYDVKVCGDNNYHCCFWDCEDCNYANCGSIHPYKSLYL